MAAPAAVPVTLKDYKNDTMPTWCPGCGDFAVLIGVQKALASAGVQPHQACVVSGIGCSSNLPHFLKSYGFHTLHGRSIPVATGAKLANPELTVVVTGGDGDGWGIGVGHAIHAMRRNLDITYIVMDNQIYGLTTGQTSPTSFLGMATKSTPEGNIENPVNPLGLALSAGATFVGRGFSGDAKGLADLVQKGVEHKGFSLIDVYSPCVTYNKLNTYDWFRERVYKLEDVGHDKSDRAAAFARTLEQDKLPIGVFFEETRPTYEDLDPGLKARGPPVKQTRLGLTPEEGEKLLQAMM
ncbi:MAG TPA: 2-oxoacid:ferredoxin oxidoreductase subunit beta [Candidatus Thermoplasmatota archaeon]|nr:2-oxoacid:ferredoxin oxidoreductase subunit beta [Candidatus Thermoplasmatota archaeon]